MTSDAKIGLLLGLVFIFIIAFVINGLPRFQNTLDSNAPVAEQGIVQGDPIGYEVRNSGVLEEQNIQEEISNPTPNDDRPVFAINNNPWGTQHATIEDNHTDRYYNQNYYDPESESTSDYSSLSLDAINAHEEDTAVVTDSSSDNERLRLDLPTSVSATREVSIDGSNNKTDNRSVEQASNPSVGTGFQGNWGFRQGGGRGQWNTRGQQGGLAQTGNPVQQTPSEPPAQRNQVNPPSQQNLVNPPSQQARITPPAQTLQTARTFQQKTYVIQEGDNNLAKIAKKLYGEQEGNRLVNINRIYEANKNILKSPDKIFIGQMLVIPQPAPPVEPQPSDVLRGSMFQNVPSVGGATRQNTTMRGTGRWYVVKEDDSLWKIAAEQLGKGTRYEEISKLNAEILADENKLKPGMKLQLPVK